MTQDPIGLLGGVSLYAFAANDPVNYTDPFGMESCKETEVWALRELDDGTLEFYCVQKLSGVAIKARGGDWPSGFSNNFGNANARGGGGAPYGSGGVPLGKRAADAISESLTTACGRAVITAAVSVAGDVAFGFAAREAIGLAKLSMSYWQAARLTSGFASYHSETHAAAGFVLGVSRVQVAGALNAFWSDAPSTMAVNRSISWTDFVPLVGSAVNIFEAVQACR
jgi:uncharacterized protein RhaS with RHS repeats